jgi:hypothetical protein
MQGFLDTTACFIGQMLLAAYIINYSNHIIIKMLLELFWRIY